MLSNGEHSFTDDTFAGDSELAGTAQILPPRFDRPRLAGLNTTTIGAPKWDKWESAVLQEVLRLTELKRGWDSYNAHPIRWDAALFALLILRNVMQATTPVPQIVPSSVGGVQLEWHERNIDLELHITGPYECELWYQDHANPNAQPVCEEITNDLSLIRTLVAELTSRRPLAANVVQH